MKKIGLFLAITITALLGAGCDGKSHDKQDVQIDPNLKVVIIRHGEKPKNGDNLSCQGQNRALALASVLHQKIGSPDTIYVPALELDDATKHSRMFQTITPFAVKYNVPINSKYDEKDSEKVAKSVLKKSGTVLMVWEHSAIQDLAKQLGVKHAEDWSDKDFDSIWIINYNSGKAELTLDKEGLNPSPVCSF